MHGIPMHQRPDLMAVPTFPSAQMNPGLTCVNATIPASMLSPAITDSLLQSELMRLGADFEHQQKMASIKQPLPWFYAVAAAAHPFNAAARLAATSPPMKRPRMLLPQVPAPAPAPRTIIAKPPQTPPARKPEGSICLAELKTYCSSDILICGNCREIFRTLAQLLVHKRDYCKLRFACKCSHVSTPTPKTDECDVTLMCGICNEPFNSAMQLMQHFQSRHAVNIYQLQYEGEDCDMEGTRVFDCDQAELDVTEAVNADLTSCRVNGDRPESVLPEDISDNGQLLS